MNEVIDKLISNSKKAQSEIVTKKDNEINKIIINIVQYLLSDDFNTLTSTHKIEGLLLNKGLGKAIIFPHYKNLLGETVYKFLGEFHQPKDNLENTSEHVYKRVKTRLDLNNI